MLKLSQSTLENGSSNFNTSAVGSARFVAPFENRPEYIHSLPTQNPVKDNKLYGNEKYEKSVSFEAKGADEAAASRTRKSKFWPREVHGGES